MFGGSGIIHAAVPVAIEYNLVEHFGLEVLYNNAAPGGLAPDREVHPAVSAWGKPVTSSD